MTDILICADERDRLNHSYFPVDKVFSNIAHLLALEGLRFKHCYVTNRVIEEGSANLFHHLYFNARITGGKVLHITDYRETE